MKTRLKKRECRIFREGVFPFLLILSLIVGISNAGNNLYAAEINDDDYDGSVFYDDPNTGLSYSNYDSSDKNQMVVSGLDGTGNAKILSEIVVDNVTYKVTGFEKLSFSANTKITSVDIPNTFTTIPTLTFNMCSNLTKVKCSSSITSIGDGAFDGCRKLSAISDLSGVKTISEHAFYNCSNLKSIALSAVTKIGESAFYGCKKLKTITIKSTKLKSVGKNALKNTKSNLVIKVPAKKVAAYKKLFKNKGNKKIVVKKI